MSLAFCLPIYFQSSMDQIKSWHIILEKNKATKIKILFWPRFQWGSDMTRRAWPDLRLHEFIFKYEIFLASVQTLPSKSSQCRATQET